MDRYPDDYVFHNLPLIIVSGLDASDETVLDPSGKAHNFLLDGGFRIKTESPTVKGDLAKQLLHAFRNQDASKLPWHSQALAARNGKVFRISYTGRVSRRLYEKLEDQVRVLSSNSDSRSTRYHLEKHHLHPIHLAYQLLMTIEVLHHSSSYIPLFHH